MKGIARTVVQLLYGSGLQRWLLGIGLVLTVLGITPLITVLPPKEHPLLALTCGLGVVLTVLSPILVGPIMFGAYSAPRAVQLIPHGRLKLVLGASATQLLLALFITVTASTLTEPSSMVTVFAITFGALTFFFVTCYWALQFRFGVLTWIVYVCVPSLLSHVFPQSHLAALLLTPKGQATVLTASVLAWPIFALGYVRQRHINLPNWKLVGLGASRLHRTSARNASTPAATHYSQRQAIRILLTGVASVQRLVFSITAVVTLAFLAAMLITMRASVPSRVAFIIAFIICVIAGAVPAGMTGVMALRSKSLWLAAQMGREQLFLAVERQGWRLVLPVAGTAMALSLAILAWKAQGAPATSQLLSLLGVPLTVGASGIYVSLLLVRGRRLTDTLVLAGYTVLLMVEFFSSLPQSATSIVPPLLGANIVVLPVLRHLARRRWQNIDWLIHKRSAAQLAG